MDEFAEAAERGRAIRQELLGDTSSQRSRSESIVPGIGELADGMLWGSIWARPGLDLRTRSLCTVMALIALERFDYARVHLRGARNVGWSSDELGEAILQLTFYVGLPVVHTALGLVADIFGEEREVDEGKTDT